MIVGGSKCAMAGGHNGPCGGRIRWHHPLKQQRIKRAFPFGAWRHSVEAVWRPISRYGIRSVLEVETLTLDDILGDTRNRVWIGDEHHERLHNARFYIDELPESVWEFARAFGLDAALENDLAKSGMTPAPSPQATPGGDNDLDQSRLSARTALRATTNDGRT